MARNASKRREMDAASVRARLADAQRFLDASQLFVDESDVSSWKVAGANAVNAGIAASDAICGFALGYCSLGEHRAALDLLWIATQPDPEPHKHLAALLSDKSDYQYGTSRVKQEAARRLVEHARRLVDDAGRRTR